MAESRVALRAELIEGFQDPEALFDDEAFNALALRVFARNFERVEQYRGYCRARDQTPATVEHWTGIPAVPTSAFRELTLLADDTTVERVFRTSGTSRGNERRGAHHVADLDLYRSSLRSTFRAFVLPDAATPRFLSLMPPSSSIPDSSLAFMISDVMAAFDPGDGGCYADEEGVDFEALERAVEAAERDHAPVLLLGTSAAFVHWLDRLGAYGRVFRLAAGSRLMDTGGYKGKGREVAPGTLLRLYRERLGIPSDACVNEYGMTELLSQRYDTVLRDHHAGSRAEPGSGREPRRKRGPGWLRSLAVDAETLEPVPAGERGILRHVDLANIDSVAAVQTEDVGRVDGHDLILEGRLPGAPARGCSIVIDELLQRR